MKKIATRFVAIIVASILTATTLFTATNVAAQEAAKPVIEGTIIPAAEVMKMIKEKGIERIRDDGTVFVTQIGSFGTGLTLGPRGGNKGSAKIVTAVEIGLESGPEKICWETFGKGENGCFYVIKTPDGIKYIAELVEKLGPKGKKVVVYRITSPEF